MHCGLANRSFSLSPGAYFSWLLIALVFLCASSPANADWKCTKGNEASTINSRKYIPGEIEFTLYDKRIYKDITERLGRRIESSRPVVNCSDGNLCQFSSDFLTYIGAYKEYWPHGPEIMNICTSSSNCIYGYCSKNETYERLVFDWKAGFVSFVKAKTKHGEAASVDDSTELNIEFTPDIVDVWAKEVKISRPEIIWSMYMVLK